jgi:hypothetical protein
VRSLGVVALVSQFLFLLDKIGSREGRREECITYQRYVARGCGRRWRRGQGWRGGWLALLGLWLLFGWAISPVRGARLVFVFVCVSTLVFFVALLL